MKNIKVIGNTKPHFLTYALVINILILSFFLFLLPDSMKANENEDYRWEYQPIALNILNGEDYNFKDLNFCLDSNELSYCLDSHEAIHNAQFRRPPVFPSIIALTFILEKYLKVKQYDILIFLQYFLHLSTSILIFLIYYKWFENFKVACLASILYGSFPLGLYLLKQPNSEVIFHFLMALFIFFFSRVLKNNVSLTKSSIYLSGFILSLIILTKPIAIFLPIILGIFLLIYYKKYFLKIIFGLTISASITLIPWQIYVQNLTDKKGSQVNFSETVLLYGLYWEVIPGRQPSKISGLMSDNLIHFMEKTYEKSTEGLLDSKGKIYNYLKNEIVGSPVMMLELLFWKGLRALYATDTRRYELEIFLINIFYIGALLVLLIKRKKYIIHRDAKIFSKLTLFLFFYFFILSISSTPLIRYTLTGFMFLIPLIAIFMNSNRNEIESE